MQKIEKWTETYLKLLKAEQEHSLMPRDLETLALAAYLTGRDDECIEMLGRAHQDHLDRENTERAVWCTFWLGMILMNMGEQSRGGGWIARGERLLADRGIACAEQGLLLIPAALRTLSGGDVKKAEALFEKALKLGQQFNDPDVISLSRLGLGQSMIRQGNVAKGLALLDEVMVAIETEKIFPVACGIIYCGVIAICRTIWDLKRAQEWTLALTRWCDSQPDIVPFRGQCLVRRAEIMQFHGEWPEALGEFQNACRLLTRTPGEQAAGEAYYRKAELHRLMGDFEKAEDSYREAAKWGRKSQPGMALLRLAQGKSDAAGISIKNALQETQDAKMRAELLAAEVHILSAARQTREARAAADELNEIAGNFNMPYLYAMSCYVQGTVFFIEGNFRQALDRLQQASKVWNTMDLPYESARVRELKGFVYKALNDVDNSELELEAARWVFEQLRAKPDLERITRLSDKNRVHDLHGLTLRELQVLRHIAAGKTNKSVAEELFISTRTVDRHVSNIFNKLNVSSRAEATAFALKNNILNNEF